MNKCLIFNVGGGIIVRNSGAHRIATFLRENNWDAEVIDWAAFWTFEQLKQLCLQRIDNDVKFIGFSYLFVDEPLEVIEQFGIWFKETYPHIKILLGAPNKWRHPNKYVDYNIHGYGERALLELLKYLFNNGPAPMFNLMTHAGKSISANEVYPSYPMNSLMIKYEYRDFVQSHEWLGIEFSRGCKFACDFCNYPVIGVKGDHTRDAEDFRIQVQDAYDRFGVSNYYVADETFNDRTEKIIKFADVVDSLSFKPFFTATLRADLLINRPADREELLRMNMLAHLYGVESFNTPSAKSIGKGMNSEKIKNGLIDIRKYFETHGSKRYLATVSLIAGLPYETVETLRQSKQWLIDHWQNQAFNILPLEIPISEYDTPSKIGLNWKKYGYEDVSDDPKFADLKQRNLITSHKLLIWKNDYMDVGIAHDLYREIEGIKHSPQYTFRPNNFSIIRVGLPPGLDERLALTEKDRLPMTTSKLIEDYVNKKLNI
jgi:RimJ/RimL family protein N-acetyltransferase